MQTDDFLLTPSPNGGSPFGFPSGGIRGGGENPGGIRGGGENPGGGGVGDGGGDDFIFLRKFEIASQIISVSKYFAF
jgi:hypothetical protein